MKKIYCMFLLFSTCFSNCMDKGANVNWRKTEIKGLYYYLFELMWKGDPYDIAVPITTLELTEGVLKEISLIEKICNSTLQNNLYVINKEDRATLASIVEKRQNFLGKLIEKEKNLSRLSTLNQIAETEFTPLITIQSKTGRDSEVDLVYLMRIAPEKLGTVNKISDSFLLALPSIIGFMMPMILMNVGEAIMPCCIVGNGKNFLVAFGTMVGMFVSNFLMGWKDIREWTAHMKAIRENVQHRSKDDNYYRQEKRKMNAKIFAKERIIDILKFCIAQVLEVTSWYKLSYAMQVCRGLWYFSEYSEQLRKINQKGCQLSAVPSEEPQKDFRFGPYITGSIALCCAFATYYYLK